MSFTIQQLQAFSNTKPELRYLTEEIIDYLEANPGGSGSSTLQSATVTLTDAQIKTLPTTPVQVITAPGENKVILVSGVVFKLNKSAGAYTNVTGTPNLQLVYTDENGDNIGVATNFSTGNVTISVKASNLGVSAASTLYENQKIVVFADNSASGNFTGGNAANTLKVTVYYVVVDL